MQVYIHREGQQLGPYSVEEADEQVASGSLQPDDLIWHEGAPEWVPVKRSLSETPTAPALPKASLPWIPPRRDGASSAAVAAPVTSLQNGSASPAVPEAYKPSPGIAPDYVPPVTRVAKSGAYEFTKRQRGIAVRNMAIGAFFLIGGSFATYYTYEAAVASPGGGTYFVASYSILFRVR